MDPDCAICHAPASRACECESRGLEVAIKQAEHRIMNSIYGEIRTWVRRHAQDHILEYFRVLSERRKMVHSEHLERITAYAWFNYQSRPHPSQISEAEAALKRGIDEDWQASVQRYPEVLEYFFELVELTLPADDEPGVKNPSIGVNRKAGRRATSLGMNGIGAMTYHDQERLAAAADRRTPGPRDRRSLPNRPMTAHPQASYYTQFR